MHNYIHLYIANTFHHCNNKKLFYYFLLKKVSDSSFVLQSQKELDICSSFILDTHLFLWSFRGVVTIVTIFLSAFEVAATVVRRLLA